ncbi:hypothetical protein ACFL6Q_01090 [Candidatus Neomarinimicrobiota bacterium]
MDRNYTARLDLIKPAVVAVAVLLMLSGCDMTDDTEIVYGPDNPDPYPANDDVAVIDSIVPSIGYPTDEVILRGSGFNTCTAFFGIGNATISGIWSDSMSVEVPMPKPVDYFFSDTVLVKVALEGSYNWSNEVSFIIRPMAHVYLAKEYPATHPEDKFTQPRGLAFDSDGNMYLSNARLRAVYQDTPAGVRTVYAFGAKVKVDGGLRVGPDGSLYAAGNGEGVIYRIPTGGGSYEEWATVPNPWGMDFDSYGNLFVVDNVNGHLYRISSDGTATMVAELPGTAEKAYCRVFEDNVYVNESNTGLIFKMPFTENSVGEIDTAQAAVSGRIRDITFGADGSLYCTGRVNEIIKVDPSGDESIIVELEGDLTFLTWAGEFLYVSSVEGPVQKALIYDNSAAPYYGRGD